MHYDSRPVRLFVAVAAAGLAFALRLAAGLALDSPVLPQTSWLCFLLGVVFSAWYGGLKPGLVTAGLLLLAGLRLESPPVPNPFGSGFPEPGPVVLGALLFLVASLAICSAMQRLRMEHFRAQSTGARLHDVLESSQDAIISLDPGFRCLYANARAGHIAKKQPAMLHGKSLRAVFPESPAVILYKELQRALREDAPVSFEEPGPGGRWYAFDAYPGPGGLNLFIRDITSRKIGEAERGAVAKALASEHDRLETVLREMPVGVVIASPSLRIELVNPAACELFGVPFKAGDDLTSPPRGAFFSLDGAPLEPGSGPVSRALRTGKRVDHEEVLYKRPDGAFATLIVNALPISTPDGAITGALGSYVDVTALRQTQKALVASESRLRRLFDSPAIGFLCGDERHILEANDAFLSMVGYTREDVREGRLLWSGITSPEHREAGDRAQRQLAARGFSDPVETQLIDREGRRIPVLTAAASDGDSHWSPWIAWVLNLSERQKLETRVRETGKLESIGLLAGGIAHDFNNILTSVLGNASLAFEALPAGHEARPYLESALRSTERAADLTRQLLAYAGKGQIVIRPVDVSALVREIAHMLRLTIPRNVELDLELAPALPSVEGDFIQFQQLLMNLVINGAEAIGDRPGMVRVVTEAVSVDPAWLQSEDLDQELPSGDYVSIEVQDNGCGMTADTRQRIFDPFFTTKVTGRGLGLAAATGIVRAHRGILRVRSIPGRGSIFSVLLPASPVTPPVTPSVAPSVAPPVTLPAGERTAENLAAAPGPETTILIVDDEAVVRQTAKAALERYGYTVVVANDGHEALDLYRGLSHSIGMILLDLTMPRMGGEETLGNILALNPAARVLLTSGFDEQDTVQRLMDKGLSGFLRKPYTAAALAAKVRDVLAKA